jgi:hypothetical protein
MIDKVKRFEAENSQSMTDLNDDYGPYNYQEGQDPFETHNLLQRTQGTFYKNNGNPK